MAATITGSKRTFLESQVRVLTAALEVPAPDSWRSSGRHRRRGAAEVDGDDADDLPDHVVEEVLRSVNDRLRRHNAAAFPPAALSHVAAQIDALREHEAAGIAAAYPSRRRSSAVNGSTIAPEAREGRLLSSVLEPGVRADGAIERGAALGTDAVIDALPETWPEDDEADAGASASASASAQRKAAAKAAGRKSTLETFAGGQDYGSKVRRLRELRDRRAQQRRRIAQLRQLERLLLPLRSPATVIQPNLVGRDGEVGRELERMRVLLQRASNTVGKW